jgi:hypothetical protein
MHHDADLHDTALSDHADAPGTTSVPWSCQLADAA